MTAANSNKHSLQHNVSLKAYNTFGIDVQADDFVTVHSTEKLMQTLQDDRWKTTPTLILGGGSNILLTQDFHGLVIHNNIMGIEQIGDDENHVWLKVGAGENWHSFVMHCIHHELAGIENLSLIPGTVGAAPIQNIGAYGAELKETLFSVQTISLSNQTIHTFQNADCEFGYRDSIFKHALKNQQVITHVTFRLNKKPIFNTEYGALKQALENNGVKQLSLRAISDAVIQIRQQKLPDPKKIGNAGSFFKNPVVEKTKFEALQKQHTNMPFYTAENELIKIPAAWLIEQCGFKGKRFDGVGVHDQQALVLVNHGDGTGAELKALSERIQQTVRDQFNITLAPEVSIY